MHFCYFSNAFYCRPAFDSQSLQPCPRWRKRTQTQSRHPRWLQTSPCLRIESQWLGYARPIHLQTSLIHALYTQTHKFATPRRARAGSLAFSHMENTKTQHDSARLRMDASQLRARLRAANADRRRSALRLDGLGGPAPGALGRAPGTEAGARGGIAFRGRPPVLRYYR